MLEGVVVSVLLRGRGTSIDPLPSCKLDTDISSTRYEAEGNPDVN
jgi:hypothetical protein